MIRRTLPPLPLRLRLALLSTALVGAILLLFSLAVYVTLGQALAAEVDRALVDRARMVVGAIDVSQTADGLSAELPDVNAIAAGGAVVQVVDLGGTVRARSRALGHLSLPVPAEALATTARGRARFDDVQLDGIELRLYSVPLVLGGTPRAVLQVARPVGPIETTLARLRLVLAAGALAGTGVCALAGLLLARTALHPIDRLTREAAQIGASEDFGRRVTTPGAPAGDEVGRLAATFNVMLDRLQRAYRRQQAALESQRRFVADASHELRTPLTTVRGNACLLRRIDALSFEDRAAAIEQIAAESERMSHLVNDLLTLARADSGRRLRQTAVALVPLVEWAAQQVRALVGDALHVSVVGLAEAADAVVLGDSDSLRQLLLILVDNAVKYTPPGGRITLGLYVDRAEAAAGAASGGTARVSVADTGAGIAADDLPHVFERFYRADPARGRAMAGGTGGTGLGLAIGQWIAEAHGGRLGVQSGAGAGSVFTVTLPTSGPAGESAAERAGDAQGAQGAQGTVSRTYAVTRVPATAAP